MDHRSVVAGPDIAPVAGLLGDPSRVAICMALMEGLALPAGELAYRAQVSAQTASNHLAKLVEGNVVTVEASGRHRYYRLASSEVGQAIEAMAVIAPLARTPVPPKLGEVEAIRLARTCYDHLAGRLGVALFQALVNQGAICAVPSPTGVVRSAINSLGPVELGAEGMTVFGALNIDVEALRKTRRKFLVACLDWTERKPHLSGALGAALADVFLGRGWVVRIPRTRAVKVTPAGRAALATHFGVEI